MEENIKEYGNMMLQDEKGHKIQMISIIGEIEGHESSSNTTKTTKYEHMLPMLASLDCTKQVDGVLFVINTIGGDVSCGLALSEMIASLSKPSVALVMGDSHSIGVPAFCRCRLYGDRTICNGHYPSGTHERSGSWGTTDV